MAEDTASQFTFISQVLFDPEVADGYMKHYVPIPNDISTLLDAEQITHVEGTLGEHAFRRTLHDRPDGSKCLKFGKIWLEQAGLDLHTEVVVTLDRDPDPDRVDVPQELAAELQDAPELTRYWEGLPPSQRKTLVYDIERAKRPDTRQKRAKAVIEQLRKTRGLWRE